MESLAVVILGIILAMGAMFFVPILLLWRKLLRTKFPTVSKGWWFLWVPVLLVASFYLAVFMLRILILITD